MSAESPASAAVLLDWSVPRKYLPGRSTVQVKAAHMVWNPEGRPSLGLRDIFFGRSERQRQEEVRRELTVGVDLAHGPDHTAVQTLRRAEDELNRQVSRMGTFGPSMVTQTAQQMEAHQRLMEQQLRHMQEQLSRSMQVPQHMLGLGLEPTFRGRSMRHMLEWNAGDNSPEERVRRIEQLRALVNVGTVSESMAASLLGIEAMPDPDDSTAMNKPRLPAPEPTPEPVIEARPNFVPGRKLEFDD